LVHWPLMGGLLHLVQRRGHWAGAAGPASPSRVLIVGLPNVTAHPPTASVPITVVLYNGPLLCGFNVAIKGLNPRSQMSGFYAMAMSFCLFVRSCICLWNLLSHSLGGSTWRRALAYRIESD